MTARSAKVIRSLFRSNVVVEFSDIQAALDNASRATTFRYLKQVPYRRSYNQNGRYYMQQLPSRYDSLGLFAHKGILFSKDGSLTATLVRLIQEAQAGYTQRELRDVLKVRVQVLLLEAIRRQSIDRQQIDRVFVYLHTDPITQQTQLHHRRELIAAASAEAEVTDAMVIQVLLTLLRHRGATPADVVRYLQGQSPPIRMVHVRVIFDRYHLDDIEEKGGASDC
jgi:hypothetical protein